MRQQFKVLGVRRFNDTVEGTKHDFTKIVVETPFNDSDDKAGFDAVHINFGKSENFDKLKNLPFPVQAELDIEMTTSGFVCRGFYPSKEAPQSKAA